VVIFYLWNYSIPIFSMFWLLTLFKVKKGFRDVFGTAAILIPRLTSAIIVLLLVKKPCNYWNNVFILLPLPFLRFITFLLLLEWSCFMEWSWRTVASNLQTVILVRARSDWVINMGKDWEKYYSTFILHLLKLPQFWRSYRKICKITHL